MSFPSWKADGTAGAKFYITPSGDELERKGKWPKGSKGQTGLFLPVVDDKPRLPQPGETWLMFEGLKDPAAAHALDFLAVGLNTCNLAQKFVRLFAGVHVVLVPDRDTAGINGMEKAARRLYGVAASVKIAALPVEVKPSGGADVRDVLAMPNGERLVREAIEEAKLWEPERGKDSGADTRRRIYAGPKEHLVADQAIEALGDLPGLYQRGRNLVSIVRDPEPPAGIKRPPGALYLIPIDESGTLDRLSQVAQFFIIKTRDGTETQVDIPPPQRIAKIVLSRRHWPKVPAIEAIIHAPVFLADGSVLATPGYDQRTGLYLAGSAEYPNIPESPTQADAERARDELLEVVCDFPFVDEAHRAAWLAMALTPAARFAFDGPVPLGAFDANVRGSGKSKLTDSIGMIHLGTDLPRTSAPADDEEFRKRITATLRGGEPIVLIDNVNRELGCASLDALLTSTSWDDRILGKSENTGRMPATTIWLASGNNLSFAADTARRTLLCRLESKEENPEEREGFRHPNLIEWVRLNRARLAVAAVTILRAYHLAGRPNMGLREWGSFEGWSNLVRNAVVWAGMQDPGKTRNEVREQSDLEAGILRRLLAAWEAADPPGSGMTAHEAITKADSGNQDLKEVFAEISQPGKQLSARSLGMKLSHLRSRVSAGKWFVRQPGSGNKVYWRVVASGETSETSGTKPPSSYAGAHTHTRTHAHAGGDSSPLSPTGSTCDHPSHTFMADAKNCGGMMRCPACDDDLGWSPEMQQRLADFIG